MSSESSKNMCGAVTTKGYPCRNGPNCRFHSHSEVKTESKDYQGIWEPYTSDDVAELVKLNAGSCVSYDERAVLKGKYTECPQYTSIVEKYAQNPRVPDEDEKRDLTNTFPTREILRDITTNFQPYKDIQNDHWVMYRVTGTDHGGYCSGAEGDDIEPYVIIEYKYGNENKIDDNFSYSSPGCTTNGSGYCHGCEQEYEAIAVDSCVGTRKKIYYYIVEDDVGVKTIAVPMKLTEEQLVDSRVKMFFSDYNQVQLDEHDPDYERHHSYLRKLWNVYVEDFKEEPSKIVHSVRMVKPNEFHDFFIPFIIPELNNGKFQPKNSDIFDPQVMKLVKSYVN